MAMCMDTIKLATGIYKRLMCDVTDNIDSSYCIYSGVHLYGYYLTTEKLG